jgi:hypothetical protein
MTCVVIVEARSPDMAKKSSDGCKIEDLHGASVAQPGRDRIGRSFQKMQRNLDPTAHRLITDCEIGS